MTFPWSAIKDYSAIVGGFLGVFNLVRSFSKDRVRLRVTPKLTQIRQGAFVSSSRDVLPHSFATIEVTNLSAFPVTIDEVGFSLYGREERAVIIPDPVHVLPKRLEPRESIDVRST